MMHSIKIIFAATILQLYGCGQKNKEISNSKRPTDIQNPRQDTQKEIIEKQNKRNTSTTRLDTIILIKDSQTTLNITHYPAKGKIFTIPEKYTEQYKINKYKANMLTSRISVITGNKTTQIDINNSSFDSVSPDYLTKYGQLLPPSIFIDHLKGLIEVRYSLSIPLTDVGSSVSVLIDPNGTYKVTGTN